MDRLCSLAVVGGFAVIAGCLVWPDPGASVGLAWSDFTIYPWWTIALVDAGLVAGALGMLSSGQVGLVAALPGVTGVMGAELAGLGFVAAKHWVPAFGMGGGWAGETDQLERLALVIGVTGVGIALVSLTQLVLRGLALVPSPERLRWTAAVVGTGLLLVLPVAIGATFSDGLDATTLAACALIYSAPWGLSVIVSGWLSREAAAAVLVSCAAAALLAAVGPQMVDLVSSDPWPVFALAGAAPLLTLLVRLRGD